MATIQGEEVSDHQALDRQALVRLPLEWLRLEALVLALVQLQLLVALPRLALLVLVPRLALVLLLSKAVTALLLNRVALVRLLLRWQGSVVHHHHRTLEVLLLRTLLADSVEVRTTTRLTIQHPAPAALPAALDLPRRLPPLGAPLELLFKLPLHNRHFHNRTNPIKHLRRSETLPTRLEVTPVSDPAMYLPLVEAVRINHHNHNHNTVPQAIHLVEVQRHHPPP